MFPLIYGLVLFTCQGWLALSSPAKYDQRQEGDVNVQIDLKDVKIIALLKSDIFDDYTNYDYAYDYADFTIKPIVKPTKPPTTTSSKPTETPEDSSSSLQNNITTESVSSSSRTTIQILENSTTTIASTTDETSLTKLKVEDKPANLLEKIANVTEEAPSATLMTEIEALPEEKPELVHKQTKRCRAGYYKSGRCHRRRISLLPLAMKIAPELVRSMRKQFIH